MCNVDPSGIKIQSTVRRLLGKPMSATFMLQDCTLCAYAAEMQTDSNASLVRFRIHHLVEMAPTCQACALRCHDHDEWARCADAIDKICFIVRTHHIKTDDAVEVEAAFVTSTKKNLRVPLPP